MNDNSNKWLSDFDAYTEKFSTHDMYQMIEDLRGAIVEDKILVANLNDAIRDTERELQRWETKYKERLANETLKS